MSKLKYKHFKGGIYTVIGSALDSSTGKNLVVYQSEKTKLLWVRDYEEFYSTVTVDGQEIKRFKEID